jgi:flagellar biosynthesis chaperone FliJ
MARFKFGLQRLLDHRERIEQEKQKAVAELERQRVLLEGRIREHQRAIVETRSQLRHALLGERLGAPEVVPAHLRGRELVSFQDVRAQAAASLGLVMKTQQLAIGLAGLHRRLDAARLELLKAATDRKAVELLREKRRRRWMEEENRRETAQLDDLSSARAARRGADAMEGPA